MSFVKSEHLEHIEWEDGTRSYCKSCDGLVPFRAISKDMVACIEGHETHPANLIINGTRPPLRIGELLA